jgi:hypothetical protein
MEARNFLTKEESEQIEHAAGMVCCLVSSDGAPLTLKPARGYTAGGWEECALVKLNTAGIDILGMYDPGEIDDGHSGRHLTAAQFIREFGKSIGPLRTIARRLEKECLSEWRCDPDEVGPWQGGPATRAAFLLREAAQAMETGKRRLSVRRAK